MRTTLADAKHPASGIARVLNLSPDDDRFTAYVNESERRLVTRLKSFGTVTRYQICATEGCITWPRHIAAIEAAAVCDNPIPIRNGWFESLENGYGLQGDADCSNCNGGLQLYDRPNACVFADIRGTDKVIRVYADVAEDADAKILLQGYDENNNWIRTEPNGAGNGWVDGEYVSISTVATDSTKTFSAITGVQKPATNGVVRLYEYDTATTVQRAIAVYEPDETRPWYRRSLIGGLSAISNDSDCETKTVTVWVKLDFIPVVNDTDWLVIGNLPAIKDMCQSIRKAEANLFEEATAWEARAVNELQKELRHYRGDGVVNPIRMPSREVYGAGVTNLL